MPKTSLLHELTRPRGRLWTWSLELEQVESGRPVGLAWEKRFSMKPQALAWRGVFALFLTAYSLLLNWERIPWPRWPDEPRMGTAFDGPTVYYACGCALPDPIRENDPASDATALVRPPGPDLTMVAVRPAGGEGAP